MGISSHAAQFAPLKRPDGRIDLVGQSLDALAELMTAEGEKPFRAKQIWHWIYKRGVTDFEAMTDLNRDLRARLAEKYAIGRLA
ncbi:MAG: 23S rRNA (adenine(2503)-C(2))-methyltransferase RlmN, partial [Pseudomonadota bacterium]